MRRSVGIVFGLGVQALFALTAWRLFWFLKGPESPAASAGNIWIDGLLALQFAVPHSVLLLPRFRKSVSRILPDAFYGCIHCAVTCGSLSVTFALWQTSPMVVWHATGIAWQAINAAYFGSWVALVYSLSLTGLGYQTGWTPWWHWLRRKPLPPRSFEPRGAYLLLRHPVYLSFLGLIWFVPVLTLDRAVLISVWTAYIFFGSWLKDERLTFYLGQRYRQYQVAVPGYPGLSVGPLGRIPASSDEPAIHPLPARATASLSRKAA
jgi:hypothetical protein